MKTRLHSVVQTGTVIAAVLWTTTIELRSASEEKSTRDAGVTETNVIPQSIFVVPSNIAEGRDPFYPNSDPSKRGRKVVAPTPQPAAPPDAPLVLNGLSGSIENKLAMINGRTFAQGETGELTLGARRISVRCIEIREKSVIIETGGKQLELFLRAD